MVNYDVANLHRNPKHWGENANEFDPSRWLEEKVLPNSYIPFSYGG